MTESEFLSAIFERGAKMAPPSTMGQINIINVNLQQIRAIVLPEPMIKIYLQCGGIKMDTGYIFGPSEFGFDGKYPTPDIFQINNQLTNLSQMREKTLFGRHDLFWFAFDSAGKYIMMENVGLNIVRTYTDPYRAMFDCLIGGKIQ